MTIRIGILGAGALGKAQMACLASFEAAQIVAVCDSDRARAEAAAQPFDASVHINFRTLLEAERLDAVFVCLPPFARGEPETLAARAGIHLFVERPVALNVHKAEEVQKEIEKSGVIASVAYTWRYLSGTERAREMLKGRKIAMVRGCRFGPLPPQGWRHRRESSGGQFVQEATDLLDLGRYVAGEITDVCAKASAGIASARLPDCDIEDAVAALLGFRGGATGEIVAASVSPREEDSFTVVADRLELTITPDYLEVIEPGTRTRIEHTESGLRAAQAAFVEAVQSGRRDLIRCDYADAARTLQAAVAAAESVRTGKTVSL